MISSWSNSVYKAYSYANDNAYMCSYARNRFWPTSFLNLTRKGKQLYLANNQQLPYSAIQTVTLHKSSSLSYTL